MGTIKAPKLSLFERALLCVVSIAILATAAVAFKNITEPTDRDYSGYNGLNNKTFNK